MAQALVFPKEFEWNFWRDFDRTFAAIWLITFMIATAFTFYMQSLPPLELSADQIKRFNEAIYRVQIAKQSEPVPVKVTTLPAGGTTVVPETPAEPDIISPEAPDAKKPLSYADKMKARELEKQRRLEITLAERRAVANRVGTLTGPTAKGRKSKRGGSKGGSTAKLLGGAASLSDLKGTIAVVGDRDAVNTVRQLQGGGVISEDIGGLTISDINKLLADPANLERLLKGASLKIPTSRKIKTSGSKSRQRSSKVILQKVVENQNQIKYCYWTYKRRDSSLKGVIVLGITINPAGKVVRVQFTRSNWNGNSMKRDIEKCIRNIVMQWRFAPIDRGAGNVTAGGIKFILE